MTTMEMLLRHAITSLPHKRKVIENEGIGIRKCTEPLMTEITRWINERAYNKVTHNRN